MLEESTTASAVPKRFRRRRVIGALCALGLAATGAFVGFTSSSHSASNAGAATVRSHALDGTTVYTLWIPGTSVSGPIAGEGSVAGHDPSALQLLSFSWGVSQSGHYTSAGGYAGGKANFQDIHFTVSVGKASPLLAQACTGGTNLGTAAVYMDNFDVDHYVPQAVITLSNVRCTSFGDNSGGGGGGGTSGLPVESITLNFSKITYNYQQAGKPPAHYGWDLATNKKV